jgi:hypothetical protein
MNERMKRKGGEDDEETLYLAEFEMNKKGIYEY